jgi:hypothetical protein
LDVGIGVGVNVGVNVGVGVVPAKMSPPAK